MSPPHFMGVAHECVRVAAPAPEQAKWRDICSAMQHRRIGLPAAARRPRTVLRF